MLTRDGRWLPIEELSVRTERVTVHNFEVEGDHNYYVADSQLLVHNCKVGKEVSGGSFETFEQARNAALRDLGPIGQSTREPMFGRLEAATTTFGRKIGFTTRVDGVYKQFRMDFDPKKGPHINIMIGKGSAARKLFYSWQGTEAQFARLLKRNS